MSNNALISSGQDRAFTRARKYVVKPARGADLPFNPAGTKNHSRNSLQTCRTR